MPQVTSRWWVELRIDTKTSNTLPKWSCMQFFPPDNYISYMFSLCILNLKNRWVANWKWLWAIVWFVFLFYSNLLHSSRRFELKLSETQEPQQPGWNYILKAVQISSVIWCYFDQLCNVGLLFTDVEFSLSLFFFPSVCPFRLFSPFIYSLLLLSFPQGCSGLFLLCNLWLTKWIFSQ